MTADPSNARIWQDADVYVAFLADTPSPALPATIDDPFGSDWDLVGLLDGDDGFSESRNEDTTDHFAWGNLYIRTSRRNFKLTRTFTAMEKNATVDRLMWPGSTASKVVVPSKKIERLKVGFENTDGDQKHRVISAYEAEITVDGSVDFNENAIATVTFMVSIFPNADGELFDRQSTLPLSS